MKNSNNNNNVNSIIKSLIAIVMVSQLAACNFLVADAGLGGNGGQRNAETVNIANATDESENIAEKAEISGISIASIVLNWTAPSARADESPISMAEIASFRVYYGTSQGEYSQYLEINDAYTDEVDLSEMITEAGTYYIVMTTIDTNGRESAYSQDVIIEV